jgi:hypothetical protein
MKRLALALLAPTFFAPIPLEPAQGQRPTFRTRADLVIVDVAVFAGDTPVHGLSADDFHVTDNGVSQRIELVSTETIPLDVLLVVDTSGSVADEAHRFWADVRKISAILRPGDGLGLMTFAAEIREVVPLAPVPIRVPLRAHFND